MIKWLGNFLLYTLILGAVATTNAQDAGDAAKDASKDMASKSPEYSGKARLEWHQQHLKMQSNTPYAKLDWKHIGPTHMSGRVTDIAKPLDQPYTFYVTTASGGVWKTTNEGTSWEPLFDDAPSAAWGAIAVDPSDSNTCLLYTSPSPRDQRGSRMPSSA